METRKYQLCKKCKARYFPFDHYFAKTWKIRTWGWEVITECFKCGTFHVLYAHPRMFPDDDPSSSL